MKKYSILFLFCLVGIQLYAQTGQVRGKVTDANSEPLVGATVIIEKLATGSYTDEDGIFSIDDLPAGEHELKALFFGFDTVTQVVSVVAGKTQLTKFVLNPIEVFTDRVDITDEKKLEINRQEVTTGVTEIKPEEIKMLPSVGAPDLAQYLQVLPGVTFTGDQGGQLYIRGGTPIQNMVLLDGMVVYSPFHSLGLFSVFDVDYIRTTDVYSAAFPAKYGGRVSSVMDIKSRNGSVKGMHVKANMNPFTSGVLLEGPIIKGKKEGSGISYLVSARNNYIDRTNKSIYPYLDSAGLPYNFLDIYGKTTLTDGANYVSLAGFSHSDNVLYGFPADLSWRAAGGSANFQLLPSGSAAIISGNFAYSQYKSALRSNTEYFPRKSGVNNFNGGLQFGYIVNKIDRAAFGFLVFGNSADYTFTNALGYKTSQQSSTTEFALYFDYKKVFLSRNVSYSTRIDSTFERFVLEPSFRIHNYNDQQFFSPEPRLRAKYNMRRASLSFSTGMYAQNLMSAGSDRDVVNLFQGFLTAPEVGELQNAQKNNSLQYSWHLLGGAEFELVKNLSTTVEAWYKRFTQLTNINRLKLFPEDPNFIAETGTAHGYDFILKYQRPHYYLYSTYSWSKVTRNDGIITYYPVFDRRHTVNFVAAYKLGYFEAVSENGRAVRSRFSETKWELSGRFTLGSGFPFTRTQGFFESIDFGQQGTATDLTQANGNLGLLLSSQYNDGRLPYYHRLDISAKRRWVFGNKILLEANANLVNAYNRENVFYYDRVRNKVVYQLPILPSLGISLTY